MVQSTKPSATLGATRMADIPPSICPVKYPKTPHLPFSPGVQDDDIVLSSAVCQALPIVLNETIVTEKLDGGNCSIYRGKVYARTISSEATHASFGPIKELAAQIYYLVPDNIQIFGENMFGIHSITYDKLESFFYLFAALRNEREWLSWGELTELSDDLGLMTVPVVSRGQFSMADIEGMMKANMKRQSQCGSCNPEGFVIRTIEGFSHGELERHMAKFVRASHVQTEETWRRTWKQAKLNSK